MTKSKKRPTITKAGSAPSPAEPAEQHATQNVIMEAVPSPVPSTPTPAPATAPLAKKAPAKRAPAAKRGKMSKLSSGDGNGGTAGGGSSFEGPPRDTLQIANIILHLKCSLNDLTNYTEEMNKQLMNPLSYNPSVPPDIMTYQQTKHYAELNQHGYDAAYEPTDFAYMESKRIREGAVMEPALNVPVNPETHSSGESPEDGAETSRTELKDIHAKLKKLKISLFKNMAFMDKKSACFWCTYDFDNPECYIPKYDMDGTIHGYGSFCRPECAAAYLMKENLDDSTKFERYHLLNHIYSKVYDYKRNIKPAPNPYYMLEKYYGNLTIQEYRKLLKSDHLLLVIDKPLTRILPELHEDNEEFLTNIYGVTTTAATAGGAASSAGAVGAPGSNMYGVYKVRRQSDKPTAPNKSNLVKEHFGIK